jgi:hypothetical protein
MNNYTNLIKHLNFFYIHHLLIFKFEFMYIYNRAKYLGNNNNQMNMMIIILIFLGLILLIYYEFYV